LRLFGLNVEADLAISLAYSLYQHALEARFVNRGGKRKVFGNIGTSQSRQQAKVQEKHEQIM
jgi:hypothetical protein